MKKKKKTNWIRFRVYVVVGVFFLLFGVVLARAFQIQVLDAGSLSKRAENQYARTIKVLPKRGTIFDKNSNELAVSVEVDSIYAHPHKVEGVKKTAGAVAKVSSLSSSEVAKKLRSPKRFVWIERKVDLSDEERGNIKALSGINTVKNTRRYYPNNHLAANIIGFEGMDSKGLEGVELHYDKYLQGVSRKVAGQRDARGRTLLFEDIEKTAATHGMDVVLTIDKNIQYIAESALAEAVKSSGAKGGMAVVMDPATGELLAIANAPTYDPNSFHLYGPDKWRNRAVTDTFEPGSVLKAFLLASVLEEGVVAPNDIFFCENGRWRVADRTFHDLKKHGWLSLAKIIKVSSNIGSAKVGEKLGKEKLHRYLKRFGFGEKSGIDLPGEAKGALRHYKNWSGVTLQTVSFGQGISVNAVQLVTALSAIANGGYMMKPYIVKNIIDPMGNMVYEAAPEIRRRVISAKTAAVATKILVGVTDKDGTGKRAALSGFSVAGKTGTAQKPDLVKGGYKRDAHLTSFLGFVPAAEPRLSIFVAIDEPRGDFSGGRLAAPVFKKISEQSLAYMGVFGEGLQESAPLPVKIIQASVDTGLYKENIKKGIVPDFRGKTLRRVIAMAGHVGADLDVSGTGIAIKQTPRAGKSFKAGKPVEVWFQ